MPNWVTKLWPIAILIGLMAILTSRRGKKEDHASELEDELRETLQDHIAEDKEDNLRAAADRRAASRRAVFDDSAKGILRRARERLRKDRM